LAWGLFLTFYLLKIALDQKEGAHSGASKNTQENSGFVQEAPPENLNFSTPQPIQGGGGLASHQANTLAPLTASAPDEPLKKLPRLARPNLQSSAEKRGRFKTVDASGGSIAPDASILQPGTAPFLLMVHNQEVRLHAALNEVYLPATSNQGIAEIVSIPPAEDLAAWQEAAGEISPQGQLVLYRPEEPREESQLLLLGTSLVISAETQQEAQEIMQAEGLTFVEAPEYAPGRYLAAAPNPVLSLAALRRAKLLPGSSIEGDFGRVQYPRNKPSASLGRGLRFTPNDPLYSSQWHLLNTNPVSGLAGVGIDANVSSAWQLFTGTNIRIGIIDDGLQITHPDLVANMPTNSPTLHRDWNDATPNDPTPGVNNPHGTACAGVAAAKGGNNLGVTGAAPDATLVGMRLIAAPSSDRQEAEAFAWRNDLIEVKNNSWGPVDDGRTIAGPGTLGAAALQSAVTSGRGGKGTIQLWAAGNGGSSDNSNYDSYANSIYAIAVSAINNQGSASWYSERGGNIALCAPSSGGTRGITTTDLTGTSGYSTGDYTSTFGGTSSACPLVAGVTALILQANPDLGWRDVKEILMRSATKVDTGNTTWINNGAGISFSSQYGGGMINASAAVELAQDWELLEPMISASGSTGAIRLPVPDNDAAGVQASIPISANFRVESVTVTVSALHLWRGDLVTSVISPAGTEVQLTNLRFDSADHLNNVTFTTPHFTGETSAGTWKVRVADVDPIIVGTFTGASITVYGSNSPRPPANDNFENAEAVDGINATFSTSNRGATRQVNEPRHADQTGGGSLWWLYRPTTSGYLTLDTSGSGVSDTLLAVYRGEALTSLTQLAADDNSAGDGKARISRIPIVAGETLRIAVDGKNRQRGSIRLRASLEVAALHDLFADARAQNGNSWSHAWSTAGSGATAYSAQTNEPAHAVGVAASRSIWYAWRPTANGTATVHTRGSAFDTVLAVYQGSRVSGLRQIASNDNEPGRTSSKITFGVRNGDVYYLAVDGKGGAAGAYTISAALGGAVAPPPANDGFTNAIAIAGAPLQIRGVNLSATGQTGEPNGPVRTSVWYRWTAPRTGVVTVSTDGSLFDTTLGVYTGSSVASAVVLPSFPVGTGSAYNDNARPGQRWSWVRFSATANSSYLICVDGARGATGRYDLKITY
jgi:subtilisin family serine protease/subtilisin-like proprotein convertase family protein